MAKVVFQSPTLKVVFALVVGMICGSVLPAIGAQLDVVSKLFIQLVKTVATPLVFFAILDAVLNHQVVGRDFTRLIGINLTNASIAIGIGIIVANLARPGELLTQLTSQMPESTSKLGEKLNAKELVLQQFPTSIVQPFLDNTIMPTVVLGLALAFAIRHFAAQHRGEHAFPVAKMQAFALSGRQLMEVVLGWIVKLIPFAVFATSAKVVAQHGLSPFKGLTIYVMWCIAAMILHVVIVYQAWIALIARRSLSAFWKVAIQPMTYAFGVNSSLVALPLTLKGLDKLGVNRSSSTLAACVGTNLNNDGIILYEGFTLLVIAQAMGMDLSIQQQLIAAAYCVIAAMGVAGIPEAGIIALSLVLSAFGIPAEMIAVLLAVDWILARMRAAVNVLSDMTGSIVIDMGRRRGNPSTLPHREVASRNDS